MKKLAKVFYLIPFFLCMAFISSDEFPNIKIESLGNTDLTISQFLTDSVNKIIYAVGHPESKENEHSVIKWDGKAWTVVGSKMDGNINALCFNQGKLYAVCSYKKVKMGSPYDEFSKVFVLENDVWNLVGDQITGNAFSLVSFNNELYVGGEFAEKKTALLVYRDTKWKSMDMQFLTSSTATHSISLMRVYKNQLVATGDLRIQCSNGEAGNMAFFDGTKWIAPPFTIYGARYYDMIEYNGELIIAGSFLVTTKPYRDLNNIMAWNGTDFHSLMDGSDDAMYDLTVLNGKLFASGWFAKAGGVKANYIAMWNGEKWSPVIEKMTLASRHGSSGISTIYDMASFDGKLILSQSFAKLNSVEYKNVVSIEFAH
jgi:hypothetical protein